MFNLNKMTVDVACPKCAYSLSITLEDVRLESVVHYPNCKAEIQLRDSEGSVDSANREMKNSFDDLGK